MSSNLKKVGRVVNKPYHFKNEKATEVEKAIKQLEKNLKEKEDLEKDLNKPKDEIEKIIRKAGKGIIIDDGVEKCINLSKGKIKISMSHLQNLINASPSGIFICDTRGWIANFNKAIIDMLGFDEEEMSKMNWVSLFVGKRDLEKYKSGTKVWDMNRMWELNKRRRSSVEDSLINKDDKIIPVFQFTALLMDKKEEAFSIIFLNRDLRREKWLEEEIKKMNNYLEKHLPGYRSIQVSRDLKKIFEKDLKETKDHLESIFENSLDAMITTNNSGHITRINRAFKTLTGRQEEDLINRHIAYIYPVDGEFTSVTGEKHQFGEETTREMTKMLDVLFTEGKLSLWEHYLLLKNGKIIPIEANVALLKDKDSNSIGTVTSFRDLTEREKSEKELKQACHELQETKEYLENIFSTSADGIIIVDYQGMITRANQAAQKMTGYTPEEMKEMHISQLAYYEDELHRQSIINVIAKIFEDGSVAEFEITWKRKDGRLISTELNAALLKDKEGKMIGGVVGVRDISERKKSMQ